MATSAETIERTIPDLEPAGLTVGGLDRLMQTLKKPNDPDLMPKSRTGPGIRGATHLREKHLTNYAIGVMATDTVVHAASVVPVYRALIPVQMTKTRATPLLDGQTESKSTVFSRWLAPSGNSPLLWKDPPNVNLGEFLEHLLHEHDAITARYKQTYGAEIYPILDCTAWRAKPWVEITLYHEPWETQTFAFGPEPDLLSATVMSSFWTRPPGVSFTMPVNVFKILAELARDTERVLGGRNSSDAADVMAA
jgi:hypothetical protein